MGETRPLWYTLETQRPGLRSTAKRRCFHGPTTRKKSLGCRNGSVNQQRQKKERPPSVTPNGMLQQLTARQSLFPAAQVALYEATAFSFPCDAGDRRLGNRHALTICRPAIYHPLHSPARAGSRHSVNSGL